MTNLDTLVLSAAVVGVLAVAAELAVLVGLGVAAYVQLRKQPVFGRLPANLPESAFEVGYSSEPMRGPAFIHPATPLPDTVPLPAEVVDYCNDESATFAQDACKARARFHYADTQNWDIVLLQLKKDDGE